MAPTSRPGSVSTIQQLASKPPGHPKMPNMSLSRGEIADIIAYIKTIDK